MSRIFLFIVLLTALCISTGCVAVMQTSAKIYDIGARHYFPDVNQATDICELNGKKY